ncbi:MAG: hypothetical protein DIU60_009800 [Actinomycetes bacterium]
MGGRRHLDPDDLARLEERIDAERHARRALQAMADPPEGERAVLGLVLIGQLTVTEAAAALGIRPGTAKMRLHCARRSLQASSPIPEGAI